MFKITVGNVAFEREQALDWLNTAIYEGRAEVQSQHALEREVEAWDTSCRIAFWSRTMLAEKVFLVLAGQEPESHGRMPGGRHFRAACTRRVAEPEIAVYLSAKRDFR